MDIPAAALSLLPEIGAEVEVDVEVDEVDDVELVDVEEEEVVLELVVELWVEDPTLVEVAVVPPAVAVVLGPRRPDPAPELDPVPVPVPVPVPEVPSGQEVVGSDGL